MKEVFKKFFSKKQDKQRLNTSDKNISKDELLQKSIDFLNKNLAKTEGLLKSTQPRIYSMAEESNIACKYDEHLICTKDSNLVLGVKLNGYSYSSANEDDELSHAMLRNQFFIRLKDNVEMNIIIKKESTELSNDSSNVKNTYAKEIIDKWDKRTSAFKIIYYLIFSTKSKNLTGFFENLKEKSTQEKIKKEEREQAKIKFQIKERILEELKISLFNDLACFEPSLMSANELINFYASYANANLTNLSYSFVFSKDNPSKYNN